MRMIIGCLCLLICTMASASPEIEVYAGGVAGVESLADPGSSKTFRALGGGLYLHNNGWAALSEAQQKQVISNFSGKPVAIELGFKEGADAWAARLKSGYLELGIKPRFIAANAFDGNNKPTAKDWRRYSDTLRAAGLPPSTLILPTFEFANFADNIPNLGRNLVSDRKDFQEIIRLAGGLVMDSPPRYALQREENYRVWLIDAIQWTRRHGLVVVWITSPHTFHATFRRDTEDFLAFLRKEGALPSIIVSENYTPNAPQDYVNVVGHEDTPNTTLGVGRYLLETLIPVMSTERKPSPGDVPKAAPEK